MVVIPYKDVYLICIKWEWTNEHVRFETLLSPFVVLTLSQNKLNKNLEITVRFV